MKCFFFPITWLSAVFGGMETVGKQKWETGLISAASWSPGLLLPEKKESSSDSSGSFPKPVAGNQAYFMPLLPLSLLLPPFHQNLLLAILAKTVQQSKAFQMPRGGREEVKLFCLFCMPELWNLPSIVLVINILGSGKQYGSTNFY